MARTKDPHAATVKAWKTRARNASNSGTTQQREDFGSAVDRSLRALEQNEPPDGPLAELEEAWSGGVADLGDKRAAYAIQNQPGYFDYVGQLKNDLRAIHGDTIPVFRNMSERQYRDWAGGGDIGPTGWTFRREVAAAWGRVAAHKSGARVTVKTKAPLDSIIMRGKVGEGEIVLDGNQISAHTLETIGGES